MSVVLAKKGSTWGATLLISGCCIGAGMIGLPVMSAVAGFLPASVAMLVAYLFATGSGLLLLEATLWFKEKVNLLSIVESVLGKAGKYLTWVLYLFLFYSLFVAYFDGGGQIVAGSFSQLLHYPISREVGIGICAVIITSAIYAGTKAIDRINRILMLGLGASFFALVTLGLSHVEIDHLTTTNWRASLAALPILLICFGYQNLVPSLTYYLGRNIRALRLAIIMGNIIPFLIYTIWNYVIIGILPSDVTNNTNLITDLLLKTTHSRSVHFFVEAFSVFALMTSFIPNALTFVDFLRDGTAKMRIKSEFLLYGLVLIPPMIFSLFYPRVFLQALGFAGGFVDLLLFGALPVAVVWIGRYNKKVEAPYTVAGGKVLLGAIFLVSIGFVILRNLGGL